MAAAEFVGDWMLCIVLRDCWCDTAILIMHATADSEGYDSKDGFCGELEQVFAHYPTYLMRNTKRDYNWMVHMSFWFMLMLIYWVKAYTTKSIEALVVTGFWWGKLREREHLQDLGIDRMVILKWILNQDWDRCSWRGLVITVTNRAVSTFHLDCKMRSVYGVSGTNRCLFLSTVRAECRMLNWWCIT